MRNKFLILSILLLCCGVEGLRAQVSNVRVSFTDCLPVITFDFAACNPVDLRLFYSNTNEGTWMICNSVSGDLTGQTTGKNKTIRWDNQADDVIWNRFTFRVEASDPNFVGSVMINGVCWATRNVGAPGTFAASPESPGMFYQWNRRIGWSSTNPMTNHLGGTTWDATTPAGTTWESVNCPCPPGWRVPTNAELQSLVDAGSAWRTQNGVNGRIFGSGDNTLFLPAAGSRGNNTGALDNVGTIGYYWSSAPSGTSTYTYGLYLTSRYFFMSLYNCGNGFSVRCVAE